MPLWLVRAGSSGEFENRFLQEGRIYLTWDDLNQDLSSIADRASLYEILNQVYPVSKAAQIRNWGSQIFPFAQIMEKGDWVALPSKQRSVIHFGKITGKYFYSPELGTPFFHYRTVEWFAQDIPRSNFDQDILYSLGAFMTICRIKRNNAENRIKEMATNNWLSKTQMNEVEADDESIAHMDLEQSSLDRIGTLILRKYKGHGMAKLINAILVAQGYDTYVSPEGPDKGIDILAAPGPFGFGHPRICVQVKSSDSALGREILDQLGGVMNTVNADQGLLVSWGGFKSTVYKEVPNQFFRVRLWDQKDIIEQLLESYDKLSEEIRTEIPLKRIWTLAVNEE